MNEIPKSIILDNYNYSLKNELIDNFVSYRCKYRTTCKMIIKINKENLRKYLDPENQDKIAYIITSSVKNHNCKNNNNENEKKPLKENNDVIKQKELGINLINNNLTKPLSFHINNFKTNNIHYTNNQIKYLLQKLREKSFPNDIAFQKITNITISFGDEPELNELPICYRYVNLELIVKIKRN